MGYNDRYLHITCPNCKHHQWSLEELYSISKAICSNCLEPLNFEIDTLILDFPANDKTRWNR